MRALDKLFGLQAKPVELELLLTMGACGVKIEHGFPFCKIQEQAAVWLHSRFEVFLYLILHERQKQGFNAVWIDKH